MVGCLLAVSKQTPPKPMLRKGIPERSYIVIDFFTAKECATFLSVINYFSRYLKVVEKKTTTESKTIALEGIFLTCPTQNHFAAITDRRSTSFQRTVGVNKAGGYDSILASDKWSC